MNRAHRLQQTPARLIPGKFKWTDAPGAKPGRWLRLAARAFDTLLGVLLVGLAFNQGIPALPAIGLAVAGAYLIIRG